MAAEAIERMYKYTADPEVLDEETKLVFFHNTLHDMESAFWVVFCLVLNVESQEQGARDIIMNKLFSGWEDTVDARWTFVSGTSKVSKDYNKLFGEDRKELMGNLRRLKSILTRYYRASEANIPTGSIDISKFLGIHKEFREVWKGCMAYFSKQIVCLNPEVYLKQATASKREAEFGLEPLRRSKRTRTCVSVSLNSDNGELNAT